MGDEVDPQLVAPAGQGPKRNVLGRAWVWLMHRRLWVRLLSFALCALAAGLTGSDLLFLLIFVIGSWCVHGAVRRRKTNGQARSGLRRTLAAVGVVMGLWVLVLGFGAGDALRQANDPAYAAQVRVRKAEAAAAAAAAARAEASANAATPRESDPTQKAAESVVPVEPSEYSDDSVSPVGIGGVRLGMTRDQAIGVGDVADSSGDSIQYDDPEYVWAYLGPDGRVNRVVLEPTPGESSGFTTTEGIGLDSSIADFQATYPSATAATASYGASAAWTPLGPNAMLLVKFGNGHGRFEVGDRTLIQSAYLDWVTPDPVPIESTAPLSDEEIQYRMERCEQQRIEAGDRSPLEKIVADCFLIATSNG